MSSYGYRVRAARPGDLGPASRVLVADELDDTGQVVLDEDFLRNAWDRADFDLAADAWVAVDDQGAVVGYAQATREEPGVVESWGVVHPEHRGRGIGASLLDRIEARAPQLMPGPAPARFRHIINAGDRAAADLLRGRGLHLVRHFWHMQTDLPETVDPGPSPGHVAITGVDESGDLRAVHAALDEAFLDHWDHQPEPFERWVEDRTQSAAYDPGLWLVARSDGEVAGALTAVILGDRGWISMLGVRAPFRGRGIAAALLRRSFATFAARGVRRVVLAVDAENPTGATRLYERVGMSVVKRWDLWERELHGQTP